MVNRTNGPISHCIVCGVRGVFVTMSGPAGVATRPPPDWYVVNMRGDRAVAACSCACVTELLQPTRPVSMPYVGRSPPS